MHPTPCPPPARDLIDTASLAPAADQIATRLSVLADLGVQPFILNRLRDEAYERMEWRVDQTRLSGQLTACASAAAAFLDGAISLTIAQPGRRAA
ncbi:hypothetical protein [Oceaniglobus trochenteri]|uniref:hypothetical protein n=1 Tax=Oceaniglobus trochenteri TaxID=2763260 RepID=UPI001CFF73BE|nr:hypothetical protein [Oceaniglobus trochenteri]